MVYFVILRTIYLASATCSSMVSYHMALLAESGLYCLFSLLTQCLFYCSISFWAFSALILTVGWVSGRASWLSVWSEVQIVCILFS